MDSKYTLSHKEHFSTTAKMLQSLHQVKVSIEHADIWPKHLNFEGTTINHILQNIKTAHKIKTKLNNLGIYAIEQCMNHTHSHSLSWTHSAQTITKIQRGRKPKWFDLITQQVNKIISNNHVLITPNPYTLRAKQINKKD